MSPSGQICLHFSCLSFIWRLWILPFEGPFSFSLLFFLYEGKKNIFFFQIMYWQGRVLICYVVAPIQPTNKDVISYLTKSSQVEETVSETFILCSSRVRSQLSWLKWPCGRSTDWELPGCVMGSSICKSLSRPHGSPGSSLICKLNLKFPSKYLKYYFQDGEIWSDSFHSEISRYDFS